MEAVLNPSIWADRARAFWVQRNGHTGGLFDSSMVLSFQFLFVSMNRARALFALLLGILSLSVVAVSPVQAQETDADDEAPPPTEEKYGGGFFALGVNGTDLGPLNTRLRSAGYPTFPSELFAVGGGGYGVIAGRLLLGGEGYGLIGPSRGFQGREVNVGGGYGLLTIGYRFDPTDQLVAYPQVGIGGGGLSLEIGSAGADRFDDVLDNPNREATLTKGSLLVSLGVGLEYRFRSSDEPGGFHLGLRAGYLLSPYNTDWTLGEDRLAGGPDAGFGGPFVRLLIGGWGDDDD